MRPQADGSSSSNSSIRRISSKRDAMLCYGLADRASWKLGVREHGHTSTGDSAISSFFSCSSQSNLAAVGS